MARLSGLVKHTFHAFPMTLLSCGDFLIDFIMPNFISISYPFYNI